MKIFSQADKTVLSLLSAFLIAGSCGLAEALSESNQISLAALLYITRAELNDGKETNRLNHCFYEAPREVVSLLESSLTNKNIQIVTNLHQFDSEMGSKTISRQSFKKFKCKVISTNGTVARIAVEISRGADSRPRGED